MTIIRPAGIDYPIFRDEKKFLRYLKPWPIWVLRLHAEILYVRFPTIKKETIFETVQILHGMALEAKLDGSFFPSFDSVPEVQDGFLGALYGHFFAHFMKWEEDSPSTENEKAEIEALRKIPTLASFQQDIVPQITAHLERNPEGFLPFQNAFAKAKENTFDKNGNLKETPLTPIYRKILAEWTVVECLSGPKSSHRILIFNDG